jgi:uncharacterized protein YndB with AHSA1/START domain
MGTVSLAITIDRPRDEVFAFVGDLTHDPQWFRGVRASRVVSEVTSGVGTEYEQVTRLFGVPFTARVVVTAYDPPRSMTLRSRWSATPFEAVYRLDEVAGGGTRYTLDATVSGAGRYRLFGPLFLPLLRWATAKRLAILKRVLEG